MLPREWTLAGTANDGSPDVIVYRRTTDAAGDLRDTLLHRLDSRTQALRSISVGMPENTRRWLVDWQSQPRVAVATDKGRTKIHWRASAEAPWQEVAEFELRASDAIDPFFVEDDGRMLVQAVRVGDTEGLYRFDPRTRTLDAEPLVHVKGFDLQGKGEWDFASHRLLGVHLRADRPLSHWFDATMAQLQKSVDAALPAGRNNRLVCGNCDSSRFLVIDSRSDRQPGEFFLLDREKMTLQRIGARRPWLREAEQGRRSFHRIMARDGLSLPVYVTHPANARPDQALPAVVLVHGGPWLRGADTNWSEAAQFLASRGYRVIEPEFRGSVGYGDALFRAGWRQWGRAMQDDLADAVRWAGAQGLIDPGRVCISGVGYGGYAALMAPIASPGVYRCAVSFGGITDIGLVFDIGWSQMSREFLTYGAPALIGDPKDRAQLDRVSPLRRAAEIKVPVLLGHGLLDPWVPPKQAREFVSAARAAGVPVEVTYYEDEARELRHRGNRADFYQRLERFLDTHLRTPP